MTDPKDALEEARAPGEPGLLATDEFYRALADESRRRVVACLLDREESTVDELAELLCGWEATDGTMVSPDRYEEIRIELYHNHLPCLDDAGLVSYDRSAGVVEPEPIPKLVERLVRHSVGAEA